MPAATFDPVKDLPHPLLATNEHSDFTRNFREMQKHSKRPYSLTRVLRSFCKTPPRFDGFEQEVREELSSLNRARSVVGKLVPIQALSTLKRDLSIAGYPQIVQTPLIRTGFCQANVVFWFWQSLALLESRFNIFIDDLDQLGEGCYPVFVVADASQK